MRKIVRSAAGVLKVGTADHLVDSAVRLLNGGVGQLCAQAGLAAGMASNIVPCVGLIIFTLLVAKLPEE